MAATWRQDLFYVSAFSLLCLAVRELGFDSYLHHTEVVKVSVLLVLSALLLLLDCHRHTNNFTPKEFCLALGQALGYAVLALPVAAVLISCGFLVLSAVLQKAGADPEHSALLNGLIYYGVLYGPLYVVYWHAKRTLLLRKRKPYLPW